MASAAGKPEDSLSRPQTIPMPVLGKNIQPMEKKRDDGIMLDKQMREALGKGLDENFIDMEQKKIRDEEETLAAKARELGKAATRKTFRGAHEFD